MTSAKPDCFSLLTQAEEKKHDDHDADSHDPPGRSGHPTHERRPASQDGNAWGQSGRHASSEKASDSAKRQSGARRLELNATRLEAELDSAAEAEDSDNRAYDRKDHSQPY